MELFRRIILAAVVAGVMAGAVTAILQQWRLVPLIVAAESYEKMGIHDHGAAPEAPGPQEAGHDHDPDAWAPTDGFERTFYTVFATLLAGTGFALVLMAVSTLSGLPVTLANGALWGLGGFLAFAMAPAFGLAPSLPGIAEAALAPRQLWWWTTVVLTGGALVAVAKFRSAPAIGIGIALIVLPHIAGAPAAPVGTSAVPAELASRFAASALAISLVFWVVAGTCLGWFNQRIDRGAAS